MLFVLFILVFVGCACVVVPLVTFGICAAKDRNARVRRERDVDDFRSCRRTV